MDVLKKLKNKVANARQGSNLPQEISQPMLDRIGGNVAGGIERPDQVWVVWCKASWASGCDKVNVV